MKNYQLPVRALLTDKNGKTYSRDITYSFLRKLREVNKYQPAWSTSTGKAI